MDSKNANLEERLKSLLVQLISESAIFERIIYKNKNQHRRSPYFQALLKVRRDLRLLQSAELGQILNAFVSTIKETGYVDLARWPKNNQKMCLRGKHTYQNRLLGVARLLSQMVEPILNAAIQISLLLAKSFFMGFSLIVLSCLARLRVLVQQALIDVVSVFNKVSVYSQKHSLKLPSEGKKSCIEYYSTGSDIVTLECVWENDKYVLRESSSSHSGKITSERGALSLESPIKYQAVECLGQGLGMEQEDNPLEESPPHLISSLDSDTREPASGPSTTQMSQRKRVAFLAVEISKPSESELTRPAKMLKLNPPLSKNSAGDTAPDFPFTGTENTSLF